MTRHALFAGITNQGGSYVAELLLSKRDEVHGLIHRSSSFSTGPIGDLCRDPDQRNVRAQRHIAAAPVVAVTAAAPLGGAALRIITAREQRHGSRPRWR